MEARKIVRRLMREYGREFIFNQKQKNYYSIKTYSGDNDNELTLAIQSELNAIGIEPEFKIIEHDRENSYIVHIPHVRNS